ncbi:MFS transporter [Arsenicicoccus bolidensis]|uniref:MHS family MFS transporter n=1 Tax=Arsenicicoccus bolidensis TaxID=229480 RepID=A0ABS9Q6L1_9MICO|nr:MFS transporter [Arsenicicoccus bolidensis]MCG7322992.1 MHS family MFS transporter [Arsenicicoccus bolidensis]
MAKHTARPDEPDIIHDSDAPTTSPTEYRRVALATMVGTTIEWYDFFIYANVAALLFGKLFFSGLGDWKELVSFATIGVSFFFRPAGAMAMGYVGDRWGRRMVLVFTLILMGIATACVGLLPTTQSIGMAAPILLIILRCLQGFSAGGEWGGAAMLAVEHAPHGQRGKFGAYPQIGVPLGMMLATAFLTVLSATLSKDQFESWGWRIPFLFSIVLVLVGHYIRSKVEESPVFEELKEARAHSAVPQTTLVKNHLGDVIKAAASFMGNNALGYMLVGGFVLAYATKTAKPPLARTDVLLWVMAAAALWLVTTMWGAILSDKIGRKKVYIIGYVLMIVGMVPMFMAVREGTLFWVAVALLWIAIPEGLTYGPQSAMFAEAFPAHIRLSAVSFAYAIGAVFGGAFAPLIAEAITKSTGSVVNVAWYLMGVAVISLVAVLLLKDRTNEPLHTMSGH